MSVNKKMPVLTQKWIEALRSGEYEQVDSNLRTEKGFCCLGVAANCISPNFWTETKIEPDYYNSTDSTNSLSSFKYRGSEGLLLDKDFERFLTVWVVNNCHFSLEQDALAGLNDEWHFTFPMIADVVESWWSNNPLDPSNAIHRNIVRRKHGMSDDDMEEIWEDDFDEDWAE